MVDNYGLEGKLGTKYNPQSNGIIKHVHQTLTNSLRTFEVEEQELPQYNLWTPFLSAAAFTVRSMVHTTMKATPAQLVFGRNMILTVRYITDWT